MRASDRFEEITHQTGLYNIQPINNIPSIMKRGLLSNEKARKINHTSIAMNEVQDRRDLIRIPNGLRLHQYANLYFDPWNPMLSKRRNQNEEICILKFDKVVLDFEDVILSDRNASSDYAAFYDAFTGLDNIDFNSVYAKYWIDDNYYEQCKKKSIKCAEVLVPHYIPFDYVMCAAVVNENAKINLKSTGFNKKIFIEKSLFF
ncbi:DUF4433 domain-containing protein [Clostridium sp. TF11-13AC]|uniref:DUF4433 domain-containing protein n=1 Tax=Clostridium sp. TF11-13AC TaxID=2293053 RepID=UPI000E4DB4E4|nr:DUF4433 domain-containing protein [Clostridium sp. TF11-13AC]RHU44980.1 DUF4433 domain-containing protein [Clostridium sp. TF11-13AC]